MSYNTILQLLDNGISGEEIIAILKKQSPKISKKISQMILGGYGIGEMLKYLSADKEINNTRITKPYTPDEVANVAAIQNKMNVPRGRDEQALNELKKATPYVASALSAIAPIAIGRQALGQVAGLASEIGTTPPIPGQPINPPPQALQTPGQMDTPQTPMPGPNIGQQVAGQAQAPLTQAMQTASSQQMGQAAQAMPQTPPVTNPKEYLQNKGVLGIVDALKAKNPPEQIAAAISVKSNGKQASQDPELIANIDAYVKTSPPLTQQNAIPQKLPIFDQLLQKSGVDLNTIDPSKKKQLQFLKTISDQLEAKGKTIDDPAFKSLPGRIQKILKGTPGTVIEEGARFSGAKPVEPPVEQTIKPIDISEPLPIQKPSSVTKGDSVITEDGNIAEVKGISGNNFLIDENGSLRQVPMENLRSQPEAIKKAKIVFDPSNIPEDERSAALAISLPMPDRSAIINMFHDGSFYIYRRKDGQPIDESVIKRVVEGQDIPISSGETFMGAWNNEKGDSRGSASFKELTALAQDASKEDDPTKPLIFEKITDGYTHGYLKEFQRLLKEAGRQFSAKAKKPKKTK